MVFTKLQHKITIIYLQAVGGISGMRFLAFRRMVKNLSALSASSLNGFISSTYIFNCSTIQGSSMSKMLQNISGVKLKKSRRGARNTWTVRAASQTPVAANNLSALVTSNG